MRMVTCDEGHEQIVWAKHTDIDHCPICGRAEAYSSKARIDASRILDLQEQVKQLGIELEEAQE